MAVMFYKELDDLLKSSIRDIDYLYARIDSLSYSDKGTLLITLTQFMLAINSDRGHDNHDGTFTITGRNIFGAYNDDSTLKVYITDVVKARNDFSHRSNMVDIPTTIEDVFGYKEYMYNLIKRVHIDMSRYLDKNNTIKESGFEKAINLMGGK